MIRKFMALGAAIALSGCVSLGGAEPPASLLTLTPNTVVPAGTSAVGTPATAIKIMEPETPARINVTRVPVQVDDTNIAYLQEAVWVEKPARLFRRLMAETIRARGNRLVIDGEDSGMVPAAQLRGTLRNFGYDARSSSRCLVRTSHRKNHRYLPKKSTACPYRTFRIFNDGEKSKFTEF